MMSYICSEHGNQLDGQKSRVRRKWRERESKRITELHGIYRAGLGWIKHNNICHLLRQIYLALCPSIPPRLTTGAVLTDTRNKKLARTGFEPVHLTIMDLKTIALTTRPSCLVSLTVAAFSPRMVAMHLGLKTPGRKLRCEEYLLRSRLRAYATATM